MSTDPRQPDSRPDRVALPGELPRAGGADQIDELDLLGWVEGDLPRARQQPVEALLAREPRLRELLEAMARDRSSIRSVAIERAPADLLAGVEARLERDLLVGLAGTDAPSLDIPVSRVVVRHERSLGRLAGRVVRRPIFRVGAIAAALLLAGSIGLVTLVNMDSPGSRGRTAPPVLLGADTQLESASLAKAADPAQDGETDAPTIPVEPAPSLSALALGEVDETLVAATDEDITPERASELLREGRLVIVVRTLDRERTLERLATIHTEPRPTWAVLDRADETLVAALAPKPSVPESTIGPGVMASGRESDLAFDGSEERGVVPLLQRGSRTAVPPPAIYLAESDDTPRALAALRGTMNSGRSQAAHFVVLDQPLPTPPATSIDSILWWNRPPSGWVRRHTLPIVVESIEKR
jgi:hypothetical protein